MQLAGPRQHQMSSFATHHVFAEQQSPIAFAMNLFEHLALAAAARPFMHDRHMIVVRRNHPHRRTVCGDPTFPFATGDEHAVHAFLGTRPRIEVVAKQFVQRLGAMMHHDLFSVEVRVPKRGSNVNYCLRVKFFGNRFVIQHALEKRQAHGEEAGIRRANDDGVDPLVVHSSNEWEHGEILLAQPIEGFLPNFFKGRAEAITKTLLVARLLVADAHAFRIATPHVGFKVVRRNSVARATDASFNDLASARHIVTDFVPTVIRIAHGQFDQFVDVPRQGQARGSAGNAFSFIGKIKSSPGHNWLSSSRLSDRRTPHRCIGKLRAADEGLGKQMGRSIAAVSASCFETRFYLVLRRSDN